MAKPSQIKQRLAMALQEIAAEELVTLRDRLSIAYPPSGPVGGYPAMRTGVLRAGVDVRVVNSKIVFSSSAKYTKYVEAIRPFLELSRDELAENFSNRLSQKLASLEK